MLKITAVKLPPSKSQLSKLLVLWQRTENSEKVAVKLQIAQQFTRHTRAVTENDISLQRQLFNRTARVSSESLEVRMSCINF